MSILSGAVHFQSILHFYYIFTILFYNSQYFFINLRNMSFFLFSCERGKARLSRVLLSYTPVIVIMLVNPVLFIVSYNKGSCGLYCDFSKSLEKHILVFFEMYYESFWPRGKRQIRQYSYIIFVA